VVTLIQRFNSAANLNIHLDCLVLKIITRTALACMRRCADQRAGLEELCRYIT
jgi:hypothetical protein